MDSSSSTGPSAPYRKGSSSTADELRVVLFGTPQFAIAPFAALLEAGYHPVCVVTQPGKPAGRGLQPRDSAVHTWAREHDLTVETPERITTPEWGEHFAALRPDLAIVVAYGHIIPQRVLDIPPHGFLNVHPSLLPRWRGPAPVQWTLRTGDTATGISIIKLDAGTDTGPLLCQTRVDVPGDADYPALADRLTHAGADLLVDCVPAYVHGTARLTAQTDVGVTHAPLLSKDDGRINWSAPAVDLERLVRAFTPWPSAWSLWDGRRLSIHRAHVDTETSGAPPGTVTVRGQSLFVSCGAGALRIDELQLEGSRRTDTRSFVNGHRSIDGTQLGR